MPTILVVDDAPDIRRLTADYLTHAGFRVLTAGTVESALRIARAERPDLRLVDLAAWMAQNLPGGEFGPGVRMDGVHLTAETSDVVADWLGPQLLSIAGG